MPLPMPRPAPVMKTTLPAMSYSAGIMTASPTAGAKLAHQFGPTIEDRKDFVGGFGRQADVHPNRAKVAEASQLREVFGTTAHRHWQRIAAGFRAHLAEAGHVFFRVTAAGIGEPTIAVTNRP